MKIVPCCILVLVFALFSACGTKGTFESIPPNKTDKVAIEKMQGNFVVGYEIDNHDCKMEDGWLYSQLKKKCFQPKDENCQILYSLFNLNQKMLVLLNENETQAEVFVPHKGNFIMEKTGKSEWTNGDFQLNSNLGFTFSEKGKNIYKN